MTCHLLDLPEEILDECLQELLPSLGCDNNMSLRDLKSTPDPVDLYRVMLTCKALQNLAYPWFWRIVHFDGFSRGNYLYHHPEAAAHVRIFVINWKSEFIPPSPIGLASIHPAIRLMENLRVLSLRVRGPDSELSGIVKELIAKPRLHTLLCLEPSQISTAVLPSSLQRLCYPAKNEAFNWSLNAMPQLTSLALVNAGAIHPTSPIPWEKLRDVEVSGIESCHSVFENFLTWRCSFPTITSPLSEVAIHQNIMTSSDMWLFIKTFRGLELRSIFLSYIPFMDVSFLGQLVRDFPNLQTLGLRTGGWCRPWQFRDLAEILETLGGLQKLKVLRWNFGAAHLIDLPSPVIYDKGFRDVISTVAKNCLTLERIEFHHSRYLYCYERDEGGKFVEKERFSFVDILQNSVWSRGKYERL